MASSLLFIADISGFTRFVNETELSHSRHVISELLEAIIDTNEIDLEVAEIEGDAVLFYKYGSVPSIEDLINQCRRMFVEFHSHLLNYKHRRICDCGACRTAQDLTIKFVAHSGDFNFLKVKEHRKPHGSDVVLTHRLLKNNIQGKEYLLLTDTFSQDLNEGKVLSQHSWTSMSTGSTKYDDIGEVAYYYLPLEKLHDEVEVKPTTYPELTNDPIVLEGEVGLDSKLLFELITNFDFRDQWNNEALRLEYEQERVNRMGTRHVCVFENDNLEFETVTNDFGPGKLVYGERLRDYKFIKEATNYFILEPKGDQTFLRIESHLRAKQLLVRLFSPFYKAVFRKNIKKVLRNIQEAAEKFKARGLDKKIAQAAF